MKVLFVLPQIPYPPESGGRIVTWNTLCRFAAKHDCWVACLYHHPDDLKGLPIVAERVREIAAFPAGPRLSMSRLMQSLTSRKPYKAVRFWNSDLADYIQRIIRREGIEVVHAQNFYAAQYLTGTEPCLRVHYKENLEGRVMARFTNLLSPPWSWLVPWEAHRTTQFEYTVARRFHHVLTISNREAELLSQALPEVAVEHCPPGADLEAFPMLPESNGPGRLDPPILLFTGTFSYPPNDWAAKWLLDKVWPRIWTQYPNVRLWLVGHGPRAWLREWNGREGVEVTGSVPDIRPYYERATIVIIPLQVGGGVKLKLLEAMALGRPVVSTSVGAEGLDFQPDHHLAVADDPDSFAACTVELLQQPAKRRELAENARYFLEERYNWDRLVAGQMEKYALWLGQIKQA